MNVLLATEGVTRVDDAPVLDSLGATIKMTEAMVDMKAAIGLGHSRHGFLTRRRGQSGSRRSWTSISAARSRTTERKQSCAEERGRQGGEA